MSETASDNKRYRSLLIGDVVLLLYWVVLIATVYFACRFTSFWLLPLWIFIVVCAIALCLPRPKPGAHKIGSKNVTYWYLQFQYARVWNFPPIKHVIFSSVVLRTIFLRCCGCKIAWTVGASNFCQISDPFMIRIGENVTIGIDVLIAGHTFAGDRLFLMPVEIAKDANIGAKTSVSPGAKIKAGAQIERYCQILPMAIVPEGVQISHNSVISSDMSLQANHKYPPFFRSENK